MSLQINNPGNVEIFFEYLQNTDAGNQAQDIQKYNDKNED
jgi:hypothetical protein